MNSAKLSLSSASTLCDLDSVVEIIRDMRNDVIDDLIAIHIPARAYAEQWDIEGLGERLVDIFDITLPLTDWANEEGIAEEEMSARIRDAVERLAAKRASDIGPEIMRQAEKSILLQTLDHHWREHLLVLEHLRQIVGLRGYGQRDPLNEFKLEAFSLFSELLNKLREDVCRFVMRVQIETAPPPLEAPPIMQTNDAALSAASNTPPAYEPAYEPAYKPAYGSAQAQPAGSDAGSASGPLGTGRSGDSQEEGAGDSQARVPITSEKISRNAACPCGSGRKYKHCHGRV